MREELIPLTDFKPINNYTAREECPWCSKGQTLEQVKSVLVKLEGGGGE